jgi:hypothetical protein
MFKKAFVFLSAIFFLAGCDKPKPPHSGFGASSTAVEKIASTGIPSTAVNYGVLGKPDPKAYTDFDPDITKRSPADNLALFRKNEQNPPQGTDNHPMRWDMIDEHSDYQRTLFYIAAQGVPQLITEQDRKWVQADEADLISSSCSNAEDSGVRYHLSIKDCKGVK